MKELYLIRHGSLNDICSGRLVGQNDQPLSAQGVAEAEACGRFLANLHFDRAYSGDLRRVRETVEAVRRCAPGIPEPIIDPRLNEYDFGTWNMRDLSDISGEEKALLKRWNFGAWGFSFPGGETIDDFASRTRAALRDIMQAEAESLRVALFSHGGVLMSLLSDMAGLDRSNAFRLWISRGAVARVAFDASAARDGVEMTAGRLNLILKPLELGF